MVGGRGKDSSSYNVNSFLLFSNSWFIFYNIYDGVKYIVGIY